MSKVIIYHANCFDGFGAAFAAWKKFGDNAKYIPAKYGDVLPTLGSDDDVIIADFSYSKEVLLDLNSKVKSLIVLDHHKTAQQELSGLDFAVFDMNKSGAVLMYEYLNPNSDVPLFFQYLQDRDLWRFELPHSREFSAGLKLYRMEFKRWSIISNHIPKLIKEGKISLQLIELEVKSRIRSKDFKRIGGHLVPIVNCTSFISETCEALLEEVSEGYDKFLFSAAYFINENGETIFSLRSNTNFDCSAVAKLYGGGGHKGASGFKIKYGEEMPWEI